MGFHLGVGEVGGSRASLLGVDARSGTVIVIAFEVDHAGADVFVLALAGLAFTVEVPDRLGEGLEDIGTLLGEGVVDVVRGDNV